VHVHIEIITYFPTSVTS